MWRSDKTTDPSHRLDVLSAQTPSLGAQIQIEKARPVLEQVVAALGHVPVMFLTGDVLEARWLIRKDPAAQAQCINVSFGALVDVSVYDRATQKTIAETACVVGNPDVVNIIVRAVQSAGGGTGVY